MRARTGRFHEVVTTPWPQALDAPDPLVRLSRTRIALETVIGRIRPGTMYYPVLTAGYVPLVLDRPRDVAATIVALCVHVVLAAVRYTLYRRSVAAREADPDRWRRVFATLSSLVMLTWDAFTGFEVWSRSLDTPVMLLVTASVVLRATGTYAASPDRSFHRRWSRWTRVPVIVAPLLLGNVEGVVTALVFVVHGVYGEHQAARLNAEFWRRIIATDSLAAAHVELQREVAMRERAEVELRLAQKLESVGRLAAGIAHEINTPLQAMLGNLEFIDHGIGRRRAQPGVP
jgi:signal transduction histidine kinase